MLLKWIQLVPLYAEDNKLNSDQLTKLYQNKRKCVEREERRVAQKAAAAEESKASMTWDMKQAARNQIFSPEGAFARLSSELFALQERLDPCLAGWRPPSTNYSHSLVDSLTNSKDCF